MKDSECCVICVTKSGAADAMVCEQCRGNILSSYSCPDCELESQFDAYDVPDFCSCGYFWADVNFLKEEHKNYPELPHPPRKKGNYNSIGK